MKKFYLVFLLLSLSICTNAQEIEGERLSSGIRITEVDDGKEIGKSTANLIQSESNNITISSRSPPTGDPTGNSAEVGITQGVLSVSGSGGSNYTVPVAVAPGINGIVPSISLMYNSQAGNGSAGYGWDIAGISTITRIPATKFHDGVIDPVDFNSLDRFAFDGQRLIVKSGTSGVYGANGTVYETENFSNIKITSYGVHPNGANFGPAYFIVEYPDGSKAYYGNSTDSCSITDWAITLWENPQGIRISYIYTKTNNAIAISSIKYGTRTTSSPINEIQFLYKSRQRPEQIYVGGQSVVRNLILSQIISKGNGTPFRIYQLNHDLTTLNYERLTSITETSGDGTKSYNPTKFQYQNTNQTITASSVTTTRGIGNINMLNSKTVTGNFYGNDSGTDFILYPTIGATAKKEFWIFSQPNSDYFTTTSGWKFDVDKFEEIFPLTFLSSYNSILPMQAWVIVREDSFITYGLGSSGAVQQDKKTYTFPKYTYYAEHAASSCSSPRPPMKHVVDLEKSYLSADFDGDGLTDVIVIEQDYTYTYRAPCNNDGQPIYSEATYYGDTYLVNLDRRITSNYVTTAGKMKVLNTSKLYVGDFNGDGKADVYVFDSGKVRIYSLNESKQFVLLFQTTTVDANITTTREVLMGDYNGDGKTDFIIPKGPGSAEFYKYSSTGINLLKQTQIYNGVTYPVNTPNFTSYVIATDYNNDGKTDLLLTTLGISFVSPNSISLICYINKNGGFSSTDITTYYGQMGTSTQSYSNEYAIPILTSSGQGSSRSLRFSFINDNKIFTFNSAKDFSKERLLKSIVNGNGVTETITYQPFSSNSYQDGNNVYHYNTNFAEVYPNLDILAIPTLSLVSKLEKTSTTSYKKQLFSYYGAVSNMQGLGFLGFKSTTKTNWFADDNSIITTVSKYKSSLRGANIENYTVLGLGNYSARDYPAPTNYITKSTIAYENSLSENKVFNVKMISSQEFNGLDNTSTETAIVYDAFNNPKQSTKLLKNGGSTEQTTITDLVYAVPTSLPYVVGRPINKKQSVVINGDSATSEEQYDYSNNLLTQIKKKANNTDFITEDNIYDTFGNITKKTITASGLAPRETNYEYDLSGRFLTKSTDIEGLSTTFAYNTSNGLLNSETNPYGLTTSYLYDSWFKKKTTTDYLGKSANITFVRNGLNIIITRTGQDGTVAEEVFDDLGRKTKSGMKDIMGTFSYVSYLYDIYDRNIKTSEPYRGNSPNQWNEIKYDVYGRMTQNIAFTGKMTNTSYSGLTTTIAENEKNKIITKNAIGSIVTLTETPGGTIAYTHFANGNLKSSSFNGVVTTIEQDGWGRKTKLTDPSAGVYTYEYNDLGETTKETTPNGTTTYTLTPVGKISQKTIVGTNTNSKTTYTYDATSKLLTNSKFENLAEGTSTINNTYTYDTYQRVVNSIETTPYAIFTKDLTYDDFGRVDKEISTATISGKTSSKAIKNTYKNGFSWQILDDSTNAVLWQTNIVDARGQLINAQSGPLTITNSYDTYNFPTQIKYDRTAVPATNVLTLNTVFDPLKGNLTSKYNSLFSWNETFVYDALDRLTEYPNTQGVPETQSYDESGRITQNNMGTYNYDDTNKPYQNTSVSLTPAALTYYYAKPTLNVTYNTFKSPVEIEETGIDKISFTYSNSNNRATMFYGGLQTDKLQRHYRKHYSADGTMEIKEDRTTGAIEFITYIGGDGYSAPIVVKSDGTTQNYLYLQRDYQGSIVAISDGSGTVLEKRIFDAWGAIAKVEDGAGNVLAELTILDRGYTGHEHLQSVGLIHMNGRLYDAKLHRFLQPDNYVQDPFNTQNYNRYGYCWNNPLKYTDPSGEFTWSDLFAAAAIVAGVVVVIASSGTLTPIAQYLIGAGVAHFLGTFAMYSSNKVGGWDAASNYVGIQSPSISINTGWGDSKSDKNGITQNVPVVKPKTVDDTESAKDHYYNGNGSSVNIGNNTLALLQSSSEYNYVLNRLMSGNANKISSSFDVNMEWRVFHIGTTNVDYKTTYNGYIATTVFTGFVRDGFWDPDYINEFNYNYIIPYSGFKPDGKGPNLEAGGIPYDYIPRIWKVQYPNPNIWRAPMILPTYGPKRKN